MEAYGVLCKRADGESVVVEVEAETGEDACQQVYAHMSLFYGWGDTAGRWLASRSPSTIVAVGEVRPLAD